MLAIITLQENLGAPAELHGKRVAPWPAAENASKVAKIGPLGTAAVKPNVAAAKPLVASAKIPLQPVSQGNVDGAAARMGPPPPKKPLTETHPTQTQVGGRAHLLLKADAHNREMHIDLNA